MVQNSLGGPHQCWSQPGPGLPFWQGLYAVRVGHRYKPWPLFMNTTYPKQMPGPSLWSKVAAKVHKLQPAAATLSSMIECGLLSEESWKSGWYQQNPLNSKCLQSHFGSYSDKNIKLYIQRLLVQY